ncbi:MAG TPA: hypothetical protein PLY56_12275, partial [Armatimonadota bacterium]|nr:hypothetical protein [Armatimonadota bacterium]
MLNDLSSQVFLNALLVLGLAAAVIIDLRSRRIPNLVTAKVGARDSVSVFNANGEAHFVADVVGYYDSGGADDGDLFRGL